MSSYYAKVCMNGHSIVERSSVAKSEYCELCGAKMLSKCPHCNNAISEWHFSDDYIVCVPKFEKPMYCKFCGHPFPWTESAIEAASLMIEEAAELSELERKGLKESLPDMVSETPKTQLASIRIKKALLNAGDLTTEALRQFVIDFGCELIKKSIDF